MNDSMSTVGLGLVQVPEGTISIVTRLRGGEGWERISDAICNTSGCGDSAAVSVLDD